MNKYLIYCLKDPTTNEIRYIGQTRRGIRRKYDHRSNYFRKENAYIDHWINNLLSKSLKPIFEIVESLNSPEELNSRERYWIEFYKKSCNLCNLTDGGDSYLVMSPNHNSKFLKGKHLEDYYTDEKAKEIREKISKSTSGENNPAYGSKNITPEYIQKQILSNSKKHLKIIDTVCNKFYEFINSKEAAKFIGCAESTIREGKRNNSKVRKRYLIQDL